MTTDRARDWQRRRAGGHSAPERATTAETWGPWLVELVVEPVDGKRAVTELHIALGPGKRAPDGGLTARDLRHLRLPAMLEDSEYIEALGNVRSLQGWSDRGDEFLALLSDAYLRLVAAGSRSPAPEMAEALGVEKRTVHAWLYRARTRGLLTKPGSGRAKGALTKKGQRLVSAAGTEGE